MIAAKSAKIEPKEEAKIVEAAQMDLKTEPMVEATPKSESATTVSPTTVQDPASVVVASTDSCGTSTTKKKKKGFKRCNTLSLPPSMQKIMEHVKEPLKEMQNMMFAEDQGEVEAEAPAFHKIGFQ